MKHLLILDNYDSFTYNLYHLIEKFFDGKIAVIRNDKINISEIKNFDAIVFSPGPKLPKDAGLMMDIIHHYHTAIPMLGICLGMQAIAQYFNSTLSQLPMPVHGQSTDITVVRNDIVFLNCPKEFKIGRYHSWGVILDNLNSNLAALAIDKNNLVMACKHIQYNIYGIQYHPESILSEYGDVVISNWINQINK